MLIVYYYNKDTKIKIDYFTIAKKKKKQAKLSQEKKIKDDRTESSVDQFGGNKVFNNNQNVYFHHLINISSLSMF